MEKSLDKIQKSLHVLSRELCVFEKFSKANIGFANGKVLEIQSEINILKEKVRREHELYG